ncbi:FCD domain-containing protein [Saccharospirillum impatiens]|uniref:FCD domain-containing protein n=1 Tax=Saccharospirillum impatiens TaxID=169438 RepID=UPI00041D5B01|nr:FCD domain-containing protein [Saccharospirillum impatiens]
MKAERMSDQVARVVEKAITEGQYPVGSQLPPERELAVRLGVSRPTLRQALTTLAARGWLETRQGGGHRVCQHLGDGFSDPLLALLSNDKDYQYDILEYRNALEGMAAWYAALRLTHSDRQRLQACVIELERSHAAGNAEEQARADADFHLAIAEASHNTVLLHSMKALFRVLATSIAESVFQIAGQGDTADRLLAQHKCLLEAILEGDAESAQRASQAHLGFVESCLNESHRQGRQRQRGLQAFNVMPG